MWCVCATTITTSCQLPRRQTLSHERILILLLLHTIVLLIQWEWWWYDYDIHNDQRDREMERNDNLMVYFE